MAKIIAALGVLAVGAACYGLALVPWGSVWASMNQPCTGTCVVVVYVPGAGVYQSTTSRAGYSSPVQPPAEEEEPEDEG